MREFERPGPVTNPEPVGPTPEELARQKEAETQAKLREQELETERAKAKAEAMEMFVRERFAQGRTEVVQQAPPEARQAQEDLGMTEEEILSDPAGAIAKLSAYMRAKNEEEARYRNNANNVIANLAKSNFKSELQALKNERYAEWIMPHVEDHFRRNPEEAFNEGRVRSVYNELVGQNLQQLEKLERERTIPPPRERVIEPSVSFSPSPEPAKKDEKQILPEDEEFMRLEHNRRVPEHYQMTAEEWRDIRSGKKYPKKISTDIQYRGAKPNVSY